MLAALLVAFLPACDGRAIPVDGGTMDGDGQDALTPAAYRCPPKPKYFCLSGRVFRVEDMARRWAGSTVTPRVLGPADRAAITVFDGGCRSLSGCQAAAFGTGAIHERGYFKIEATGLPYKEWVVALVDDADSSQDRWVPASPEIPIVSGGSTENLELLALPRTLAEAWSKAWGWSELAKTGTILHRVTNASGQSQPNVTVDCQNFDIPAVLFADDIAKPPYLTPCKGSGKTTRSGMLGNPFYPATYSVIGPCHIETIRDQWTMNGVFVFAAREVTGC